MQQGTKTCIRKVGLPKPDFFQVEGILDDARCGNTYSKNVLLRWEIIWCGNSVDLREITDKNTALVHNFKQILGPIYRNLGHESNILFGRICQLVFSTSVVALLDPRVRPQVFDGLNIRTLKRRDRFEVDGSYQFGFFLFKSRLIGVQRNRNTHMTRRVPVLNFEEIYRTYHALHGHKYILVDQLDESPFVFIGVAWTVNNSHLFDKCRLARFTSPCRQKWIILILKA